MIYSFVASNRSPIFVKTLEDFEAACVHSNIEMCHKDQIVNVTAFDKEKLCYWIFAYYWCETYISYLTDEKSIEHAFKLKSSLQFFSGYLIPPATDWQGMDLDHNPIECLYALSHFINKSIIYDPKDPTDLYILLIFSMVILPSISFLMGLSFCYLFLACCPAYVLIMMGTLTFRTPVVVPSQEDVSLIKRKFQSLIQDFFDKNLLVSAFPVIKLSNRSEKDPDNTLYYSMQEPPQDSTLQALKDANKIQQCYFNQHPYYLYKPTSQGAELTHTT